MALYDDYLTHDDKPFVENINDALLLSNVFDMTVQVDAPEMFSNQTWVNTTSPRKCSVSVLQLKEALPSGVSVSTSNNKSVLTGTGTVKLGWYPNFNAFGKYKSISWTGTGTIKVNLKTTNGATIANDIANGTITSESVELRKLQEIVIEIVLTNATLTGLSVVMENKQSTRYGATVGISDVTGLNTRLTNIEDKNTSQDTEINNKVDKVNGKGLSSNDFTDTYKSNLDDLVDDEKTLKNGHTHNGWQEVTLSDEYASLYVNMDLRLAEFRYYQQNVSFPSTSDKTVASEIIPTEYRPLGSTPISLFNPNLGGNISHITGSFSVATLSTGNKTVNAYGIWRF